MNLKEDRTHGIRKEEETTICSNVIGPILKEGMKDSINIQKDMRTVDPEAQVTIQIIKIPYQQHFLGGHGYRSKKNKGQKQIFVPLLDGPLVSYRVFMEGQVTKLSHLFDVNRFIYFFILDSLITLTEIKLKSSMKGTKKIGNANKWRYFSGNIRLRNGLWRNMTQFCQID